MPKITEGAFAISALVLLAAWLLIGLPLLYYPGEASFRSWLTHDAAGFFTFGLVVVGIGQALLFFFQLNYMRRSMKDAETAAIAARDGALAATASAQLAREQFIFAYRPRIRVKHVWIIGDIWHGEPIVVSVVFVNVGVTVAQLVDCNVAISIIKSGRTLPPRPTFPTDPLALNSSLPSGIALEVPEITDGRKLADEENVAIREGTSKLYCTGFIHYRDGKNNLRTTAFCRVMERPERPGSYQDIGRLKKEDDPDYEYED